MNPSIPTHQTSRFNRGRTSARWCGWMLFMLLAPTLFAQGPSVRFSHPETAEVTVPEGHIVLHWEARSEETGPIMEYQLEQLFNTSGASPRIAYQGPDTGTFVSGLPDDGAVFRLRARANEGDSWGPWSETITVRVAYPPDWQVGVLTAVGGLMFLVLLGAILAGARRSAARS